MGEMMQKTVLNEAKFLQLRGHQEEVQGCCHAESSHHHLPACARHQHQDAVKDLVSEVLREEVHELEENPGDSQHKSMYEARVASKPGQESCHEPPDHTVLTGKVGEGRRATGSVGTRRGGWRG